MFLYKNTESFPFICFMCSALQEGEILRLNEAREKYQKQIHDAERKYKEKLSQLEDQLV